MSTPEQHGFLSRWSRRKQGETELNETNLPDTPNRQAEQEIATPSEPDSSLSQALELTDADMPPLETIHAGSDVSMFFGKEISAALKQQALRKLFHQPEFNVRCPLDEYAEDYSQMPLLSTEAAGKVRQWAKETIEDLLENTPADNNTTDDEQTHHDSIKHQSTGTETGDQQPASSADDPEQQHQLPK